LHLYQQRWGCAHLHLHDDTVPHHNDAVRHDHHAMRNDDDALRHDDDALRHDDDALRYYDSRQPVRHDSKVHRQVRVQEGARGRAPQGVKGGGRIVKSQLARCSGRSRVLCGLVRQRLKDQGPEEFLVGRVFRPLGASRHRVSRTSGTTAS